MTDKRVGSADFIELVRERLADHRCRPLDIGQYRPAAVLILLYRVDGETYLLLTRRTDNLEVHSGQICFPGGSCNADDYDIRATALREAAEEVGVDPAAVEIIAELDHMITISDFHVTPILGVLRDGAVDFRPNPDEVAEIIEVPVAVLLNPQSKTFEQRQSRSGGLANFPVFVYQSHRVWGATARMLEAFLNIAQATPATTGAEWSSGPETIADPSR